MTINLSQVHTERLEYVLLKSVVWCVLFCFLVCGVWFVVVCFGLVFPPLKCLFFQKQVQHTTLYGMSCSLKDMFSKIIFP